MRRVFLIILAVSLAFAIGSGTALAGGVAGEGTHFEVTDSDYLNVVLDSTEPISLMLESVPETINMQIEPVTQATTTWITLSGLVAGDAYYMYEDFVDPPVTFNADALGAYTYEQDISITHHVLISPTPPDEASITDPSMQEGTYFTVTDSDYLNISVESAEPVKMNLLSVPSTITLQIEPLTTVSSTFLTIGGLQPNFTYYKYEDNYHNLTEFVTDSLGQYSYTQDLTKGHTVHIQQHPSTIFLSDDATGGDCTSIGVWDAVAKTCSLTTDVYETIQIDSDGITLDGNGYSLVGSGGGSGVYAYERFGITIRNINIRNFTYGIQMRDVFNSQAYNVVENNNISDTAIGILWTYASRGRIENNHITNVGSGISSTGCKLLTVKENIVIGGEDSITSYGYGIYLGGGSGDVIKNITTGFYAGLKFNRPNGDYAGRWEAIIADYNLTENNYIGVRVASNWGWSRLNYNIIRNNTIGYYANKDLFRIQNNNFIDNTQQLDLHNGYYNWSGYWYNYWSNFDTPEEGCINDGRGYCTQSYDFGTGYNYRDHHPRVSPVQSAGPPQTPIADAGLDQTVECVDYSATLVTLDGSNSYEPYGDTLTYSWSPFDPPATGMRPTVSIPYGSNTVTLTVDNGNGETDSDSAVINVTDTTAPSTTAVLSGTMGENEWYISDVTIMLNASDGCTDVAEIHCAIDGVEKPVTYGSTATYVITEDGAHTVSYWALDNAGNAGQPVYVQVNRETAFPVTTVMPTGTPGEIGGEPTGYFTSCVSVELIPLSVSGAAAVEYSQDDGQTWSLYTVPLNICIEGLTTWLYRTRSAAGHLEEPNTLNLYVDLTPPTTTHEIVSGTIGANNWYISDVTIKLTSVDATSGVAELHYKIDDVEQPVVYGDSTTSPLTTQFTITEDGEHTVTYWAVDNAGKAGQEATTGLSIETNPPVTNPVLPPLPPPPSSPPPSDPPPGNPPPPSDPPPPHYSSCITVQLVTTSSSGVLYTEYSDDNGLSWHTYDGSFDICDDGATVITYRSASSAGNVEPEKSFEINIDKTPPTIIGSFSPSPNASGWNNSDVVVSFNCADATSSIASCTSPVTVTTEGAGQVVTGTAVDMGSNSATTSVTLDIDKSAPTIVASVTPLPNANGWHDGDVVVSFECADALSGISSCSAPVTVTAEGAGQVVTGTAVDVAGNTSTASVTLNIDKSVPTITSSVIPEPNADGWNNTDTTVTFTCDDAVSYMAECTSPVTLTTDSAGQVVTGAAVDAAGYYASTSVTVNIDKTAPTIIASVTPLPNSNGWHDGDVVVSFECTDALSGIASCSEPVTVTTEGTGQIVSGTAVDVAGNTSTASVTLNIDKSVPTISSSVTPEPNADGWNNTDTTVTFTCDDAVSYIAECTSPVTLITEGAGQVVTGTAVDAAGYSASTSVTVNLDKTAPAITITGVTEGVSYPACAPPTPGYTVDDVISGTATHSATLEGGNTNGVGTYTYTVTATDNAENTATETVTYEVIYSFDGFQTPVTLDRPFKLGSTIPVKFVLTDGCGAFVSNATATLSIVRLSGTEPIGDPIDGSSNVPDAGNVFRFVPEDNHYVYNLSTVDRAVGSWRITVTLDDTEQYTVDIGIK